ncbi:Z-ring formation inhibitor MciZ [Pseudalkalibacillus caeni]|uniref:Z-ring formation inhibitor MciZ n=1 Tax=Exobacillus caeni TaxID=2574798 RepID=A0A5R9EZV9_9BACL|nr:Z-ring formation inhibitor MciZ [Pseudalkalibacillus caeni]TLS35670.1 Z-ring formation inhibitor MciZ [Pseudalkalibacillus caeni]
MKIYIKEKSITMVGKPWQIKSMIKQYMQQYETVEEWIQGPEGKQPKKDHLRLLS